jgi:hypothetical protein
MSRFSALSPQDLEELVADLLGAEAGARYECFARGPDMGIDLRRRDVTGQLEIVQVKHYERSSFADLHTAAVRERGKLELMNPRPDRYRFVTSRELTTGQKSKLIGVLSPFIEHADEIISGEDLGRLLVAHQEVERAHPKLWLSSGVQLREIVHADVRERSRALLDDIDAALPTYVRHRGFGDARERLHRDRVLILTGDPGVGKTTLAHLLVADALAAGFDEPVAISRDPDEAFKVFDPARRQILLYDDFLGRIALERLDKNQDRELTRLIRAVVRTPHTLLVFTTRDYILDHALQVHEELRHGAIGQYRFLLHTGHYDLPMRGRVFVNHAYRSRALPVGVGSALLAGESYLRILEHPNYNPRRIGYLTGTAGLALHIEDPAHYPDTALSMLDDSVSLWRQTFRHELGREEQALLLALVSAGCRLRTEDLLRLYAGVAVQLGAASGKDAFEDALNSLEHSMVRVYPEYLLHNEDKTTLVVPRDPSVEDFLTEHVREDPGHIAALLKGAAAFEQLEWLMKACRAHHIDSLLPELADAIRTTYRTDPVSWIYNIEVGEDYVELGHNSDHIWRRFVTVRDFVNAYPALQPLLQDWWNECLAGELHTPGVQTPSHRAVGSRDDLLALAEGGREYLESIPGGPQKLAKTLTDELNDANDWIRLAKAHGFWPTLFEPKEWHELQKRAEQWIMGHLSEQRITGGFSPPWYFESDLDELVDAARAMQFQIPDAVLDRARAAVFMSEDELPEYREPPRDEEMPLPTAADRLLVRSMFELFTEEEATK